MPLRAPKMYGFIFGFQRLVLCPKWDPASSRFFIVTSVIRFLDHPPIGSNAAQYQKARGPRNSTRLPTTSQVALARPTERTQERGEVRRKRCRHDDPLPRGRMIEGDLGRMDRPPRKGRRPGGQMASPPSAVRAVPDDRMPERGEMHPQLMGPSGFREQIDDRDAR